MLRLEGSLPNSEKQIKKSLPSATLYLVTQLIAKGPLPFSLHLQLGKHQFKLGPFYYILQCSSLLLLSMGGPNPESRTSHPRKAKSFKGFLPPRVLLCKAVGSKQSISFLVFLSLISEAHSAGLPPSVSFPFLCRVFCSGFSLIFSYRQLNVTAAQRGSMSRARCCPCIRSLVF